MKSRRVKLALALILPITIALALLASVSQDDLTYFHTVNEVLAEPQKFQDKNIRILGLVERDSVHWDPDQIKLEFVITEDGKNKMRIEYSGIKPDMFREQQGVVVEGKMTEHSFSADTLLVKHSEEYKVIDHQQKKEDYLRSITQE